MLESLKLEDARKGATLGVKPLPGQILDGSPIPEDQHTNFRALGARCNYLAADRPDIQFSAKEICRWMANPTELSMAALRRLGRYLTGRRRLVFRYPLQTADRVEFYSDTDWSGCVRTRKSTSGWCIMVGSHVLKTLSSTQPSMSLSSGEAE